LPDDQASLRCSSAISGEKNQQLALQ